MMNLFDVSIYPRYVEEGRCFSCEKVPTRPSPKTNLSFKRITGRDWPGGFISLNLKQDFKSLGLEAKTPARMDLCCDCSVAYMKKFNVLLNEKKNREKDDKKS